MMFGLWKRLTKQEHGTRLYSTYACPESSFLGLANNAAVQNNRTGTAGIGQIGEMRDAFSLPKVK
ncbi:MAG: hypothetical protein KDJ90_09375 [Nitratireductor sp.]|nr:hypothetical protein [Nitratireductor sp.]